MIGFRWIARSRLRLALLALVGFAAVFGLAIPITAHIRDASVSPGSNLILMSLWLFSLLPATAATTVLIGERLFGVQWRRQVVLGEAVVETGSDFDNIVPPRLLLVSLIAVGQMVGSAALIQTMTGDFFAEYGRIGFARTMMRGERTDAKIETLGALSEVHQPQRIRAAIALAEQVMADEDQPISVRTAAVTLLGRLSKFLVGAIESWRVEEGRVETWERTEARRIRTEDGAKLVAWATGPETNNLSDAAALTLGKIHHRKALPALLKAAQDAAPSGRKFDALLRGIGLTHDASQGLAPLVGLVEETVDPEAFDALAFAVSDLSRTYVPGTDKAVEAEFEHLIEAFGGALSERSLRRRCAAADVLAKTGHTAISPYLFKALDASTADEACPALLINLGDRAESLVAPRNPLQVRLLTAIALVAGQNEAVIAAVQTRLERDDLTPFLRMQLKGILDQTGSGRP